MRHLGADRASYRYTVGFQRLQFDSPPTHFRVGDLCSVQLTSRSKHSKHSSQLSIIDSRWQAVFDSSINFPVTLYERRGHSHSSIASHRFDSKLFNVTVVNAKSAKCHYEAKLDLAAYSTNVETVVPLKLACQHGQTAVMTVTVTAKAIDADGRSGSDSPRSVSLSVSHSASTSSLPTPLHHHHPPPLRHQFSGTIQLNVNDFISTDEVKDLDSIIFQPVRHSPMLSRSNKRQKRTDVNTGDGNAREMSLIESLTVPAFESPRTNPTIRITTNSIHTPLNDSTTTLEDIESHEARYRAKMEPVMEALLPFILPEALYSHPAFMAVIDEDCLDTLPWYRGIFLSSHSALYESASDDYECEQSSMLDVANRHAQSLYWHSIPSLPIILARILALTHAHNCHRNWLLDAVIASYVRRVHDSRMNYGALCYWINALSVSLIAEGESFSDRVETLSVTDFGQDMAVNRTLTSINLVVDHKIDGRIRALSQPQLSDLVDDINNESYNQSLSILLHQCLESLFEHFSFDLSARIPVISLLEPNPVALDTVIEFFADVDRCVTITMLRPTIANAVVDFVVRALAARIINTFFAAVKDADTSERLLGFGLRLSMIHTALIAAIDRCQVFDGSDGKERKQSVMNQCESLRSLSVIVCHDFDTEDCKSLQSSILNTARMSLTWCQLLTVCRAMNDTHRTAVFSQRWLDKIARELASEAPDSLVAPFPSTVRVDVSWRLRPFRASSVPLPQLLTVIENAAVQKFLRSLSNEEQLVIGSPPAG